MTDLDPEYVERIRDLDHASSPTIQLSISPPGTQLPEGEGGGQQPLDQSRVKSVLQSFGGGEQGPKPMPPMSKETEAITKDPTLRGVLDKVLKQMTGVTSGEIQQAIETGKLKELGPNVILRGMNFAGNAIEPVIKDALKQSGLPENTVAPGPLEGTGASVERMAMATTFFAGLLYPGSKGKNITAAREVGAAAAAARGAETQAAKAKRLIKIEPATTEQAKRLAGEGGGMIVGDRALKMDWQAVEPTGDLNAVLNRVAEEVKDQFIDAKRGVIKDSTLANMAKQAGLDIKEILARKPGQIFTVERQMAAQMVAGQLGLEMMRLRGLWRAVPPGTPEAAQLEEQARRVAALLMTVTPQMRASTSEAARVTRIAGIKMPGVQEAKHQEEILKMIGAYSEQLVAGMDMATVMQHMDTFKSPTQVNVYFQTIRALLGGISGGILGAEGGGEIGGTPGAIAGGAAGAVIGSAAAMNPAVLMEAWINGLLSGQLTYVVNITTEMASTVNGVIERGIAASHKWPKGGPDRVVPGEATVMAHAGVMNLWRNFNMFSKSLTSEWGRTAARAGVGAGVGAALSTPDTMMQNAAAGAAIGAALRPKSFLAPDQELSQRALSAEGLRLSGPLGRAADVVGSYMRAPSRGLVKADDYIKGLNVDMQIAALAHRGATLQGFKPGSENYRSFVRDFFMHPDSTVMANAQEYASYIAFQSETNRAIAGVTAGNPLLRVIAPFTFTPANVLSMSFERMPIIQRASSTLREDLAAGGAREQLARAKIDMGIAMTGFAWYLAAGGMIHGHGSANPTVNKLEREVLKRQPYSFDFGEGLRVSFNRFDPWAMHFGIVATVYEMSHEMPMEEWTNILGALVVAGADQWLSKSYLMNTAAFTDAITEGRRGNFRNWEKFAQGLAASTVPTVVANVERVTDPTMREVDDYASAILQRLPGFSQDLKPRLDYFAEVIMAPHVGWEILDGINPFYVQRETMDQRAQAIVAEFKRVQAHVTAPDRNIGPGTPEQIISLESVPLPSLRLNDDQFYKLRRLFGKGVRINGMTLKDYMYDLIKSDSYTGSGILFQRQMLMAANGAFRAQAEKELQDGDPVLKGKVERLRDQQIRLMREQPPKPQPSGLGGLLQSLGR